ncbi:MAG: DNA polymerase III subunit delta, partial [Acidobacteria bacterium]|nr:DNA polymerase III subunit delta [Acidobacteriota bacterium]
LPMMSPYRLLVVQDVAKLREADQASLESYLADPAPRTLLIFESGDMDQRSSLFKLFGRTAVVVEEDRVQERDLPREILSRAERAGFRMEPGAAERLVSFVGTDRPAIENELSKLMLNANDSRKITVEGVEELVGRYRQRHIFDLVDAVGSRNLDLALQILNRMLEDGENHIGILSMLARHFRQMLLVKEQGSRAKIYPSFLLDKLVAQARRYDREKIIQCISQIAGADLQFKTTWVHPQLHLEMLLFKLNQ